MLVLTYINNIDDGVEIIIITIFRIISTYVILKEIHTRSNKKLNYN